jgi:dethiobiotin synthetase
VVLADASGEAAEMVCPPHRTYGRAMAPPMAAAHLGRPPIVLGDLVSETTWPEERVDVGLVETAGGVRSPMAVDGDAVALCAALEPDLVMVVADAGLGTLNAVRLSVAALGSSVGSAPLVVLNRFDGQVEVHRANLRWLRQVDGFCVLAVPGDEAELVRMARYGPSPGSHVL